jgi:hypothetical protein
LKVKNGYRYYLPLGLDRIFLVILRLFFGFEIFPQVLMGVKMAVTKIKSADLKARVVLRRVFATLSDSPAGQNSPVNAFN